jgi:hypothetical protein
MQFYITRNGLQLGPYDEETLEKLLRMGAVTYDSLAWVEGLEDWRPLREITPPPDGESGEPDSI